jgi:hypothetical protein
MAAIGNEPEIPSSTEDVPATPGWVEQSVDEIFSILPHQPAVLGSRNAYLDCLAGARGPDDMDAAHDRCRRTLIGDLRERQHFGELLLQQLDQKLEALEAEITTRI